MAVQPDQLEAPFEVPVVAQCHPPQGLPGRAQAPVCPGVLGGTLPSPRVRQTGGAEAWVRGRNASPAGWEGGTEAKQGERETRAAGNRRGRTATGEAVRLGGRCRSSTVCACPPPQAQSQDRSRRDFCPRPWPPQLVCY